MTFDNTGVAYDLAQRLAAQSSAFCKRRAASTRFSSTGISAEILRTRLSANGEQISASNASAAKRRQAERNPLKRYPSKQGKNV